MNNRQEPKRMLTEGSERKFRIKKEKTFDSYEKNRNVSQNVKDNTITKKIIPINSSNKKSFQSKYETPKLEAEPNHRLNIKVDSNDFHGKDKFHNTKNSSNEESNFKPNASQVSRAELIFQELLDIAHSKPGYEGTKLAEALQRFMGIFENFAQNELTLGLKSRELERKITENIKLNREIESLKKTNESLSQELDYLKERLSGVQIEINTKNKAIKTQENHIQEEKRKNTVLESRIEFILSNEINFSFNDKEKLRKCLTEIMKENEGLRKENQFKTNEIERLREKCNSTESKLHKLEKRLQTIKQSGAPKEEGNKPTTRYNSKELKQSVDPLDLVFQTKIPESIDFRINCLKTEYVNIINELLEKGPITFAKDFQALTNEREKQDINLLIISQFISFREFSEKQNSFIKILKDLLSQTELIPFIKIVNKIGMELIDCTDVHLWLHDHMSGIVYTFDSSGKEIRALSSRGLFGEVFRNEKPLNRRDIGEKVLYQTSDDGILIQVASSILLPIFNSKLNNIVGLFEISNINHDSLSFDEEYFSISLHQVISQYLLVIIEHELLKKSKSYYNYLLDSFIEMIKSESEIEFSKKVYYWLDRIYGVKTGKMFFLNKNELSEYFPGTNIPKATFPSNIGLAGYAASIKQPFMISDIRENPHYNPNMDVNSLLPLLIIPIVNENECLGVIEVILKKKISPIIQKKIQTEIFFGECFIDESIKCNIQYFSEIISAALVGFYKSKGNK